MSDIDEVSRSLGRLESGHKNLDNKIDRLLNKMDDTHISVLTAHSRLDKIEPSLEELQKIKRKGVFALLTIGLAGGASGSGVMKLLTKFLGN